MKFLIVLVACMSLSNTFAAPKEINTRFAKLALYPGYCGEVDPYIVGDACVFRAIDLKTKETLGIYDNADAANSDLAIPASEHKLVEGKNCIIAEIYQTEDLIGAYGEDAYMTKVLKRITCRN